jgi:hypothetical protein
MVISSQADLWGRREIQNIISLDVFNEYQCWIRQLKNKIKKSSLNFVVNLFVFVFFFSCHKYFMEVDPDCSLKLVCYDCSP